MIDLNLSPLWTEFLLKNDIEAVHWSAIGKATDPDVVIFDFAILNNYVVFTNDLDFGSILAATNLRAPSVFQVRSQSLLPEQIGKKVVDCLKQYLAYLEEGSLVTYKIKNRRCVSYRYVLKDLTLNCIIEVAWLPSPNKKCPKPDTFVI